MVILVMTLMAFTQTDWKSVSLLEKVTISMPVVPEEMAATGPQKVKKCRTEDSTELGVIILDLKQVGATDEELESLGDPEVFKEQIKMGITQSGATIKAESTGKYNDQFSYCELDLEITKNGKKTLNTSRILLVKHYLLTLTYQPGSNAQKDEIKRRYFNSLVVSE